MNYATPVYPKCYTLTVQDASLFDADNLIEFDGTAIWAQIRSLTNTNVSCRLNGDEDATFTLYGEESQNFNRGEVHLTSIDFQSLQVSGGTDVDIEIIVGIVP